MRATPLGDHQGRLSPSFCPMEPSLAPPWPSTNPACPADLHMASLPWCLVTSLVCRIVCFQRLGSTLGRMTPAQVIYPARESGAVTGGSPRSHHWPGSFKSQQPAGMGWPPSLFPFPLALTFLSLLSHLVWGAPRTQEQPPCLSLLASPHPQSLPTSFPPTTVI